MTESATVPPPASSSADATDDVAHGDDTTALVRPAPHGLRLAAFLVDLAVVAAAVAVASSTVPFRWLPLAIFVAYHTLAVWLTGQTIGKALFGQRVRRISGRPLRLWWVFARSSIGYLGVDLLGLGCLAVLFTRANQALHDLAFHSVVVLPGDGRITVAVLGRRLAGYAAQHERAEQDRGIADVRAAWGSVKRLAAGLAATAETLARVGGAGAEDTIDAQSTDAGGKITVRALPVKFATAAIAATTTITGSTVTQVEPLESRIVQVATVDPPPPERVDPDPAPVRDGRGVQGVQPTRTSAPEVEIPAGESVDWNDTLNISVSRVSCVLGTCDANIAVSALRGSGVSQGENLARIGWSTVVASHQTTLTGFYAVDDERSGARFRVVPLR